MINNNFVIVNQLNNTARYLTPLIFNRDAINVLQKYGLMNVYLDDYGNTRKYKNCLFFLFGGTSMMGYDKFEDKITSFNSFYDFYDIIPEGFPPHLKRPEYRMYVFAVHPIYYQDLFSFKHGRFDELSSEFYKAGGYIETLEPVKIDMSKEIYRFNKCLQIEREAD